MEGTILAFILMIMGISIIVGVLISYYKPHIKIVQDVDLKPVIIVWYNKYTPDGEVTREHKILYDKGRNKK